MHKFYAAIIVLCSLADMASGFVVSVHLAWNAGQSPLVQEGSIIQLVAFSGSPPVPDAASEFAAGAPGVYDPSTAPEDHDVVAEWQLGLQGNAYRLQELYVLLGDYEGVYLRIFSAAGFGEEPALSYWGLGNVALLRDHGRTSVSMRYADMLPQPSAFAASFEVIPEPPPAMLLLAGSACLALKIKRRARPG